MPEEYQSGNGLGQSAAIPDDFEPSAQDIDNWQGDAGQSPVTEKDGEPEHQQDPETPEQEQHREEPKAEPKDKRTPLQKHREERKQSWEKERNELYKQNRILSKQIRDAQTELQRIQQGADKSPEDWLKLAEQFEQYGDLQRANEARAEAQRVHQLRGQFQSQEAFRQQWQANEQEIYEQDPDIFTEGTETHRRMQELFQDKELAERYLSHHDGIWAAYHRVKLEEATELIPKLVQVIETYQAELEKHQKGSSPLKSSPGRRSTGPKSFGDMNEDELEKAAMQEAYDIDSGRRY